MMRPAPFIVAACLPCLGFTWASVRMFLAGLVWQGVAFAVLAVVTTPRWR